MAVMHPCRQKVRDLAAAASLAPRLYHKNEAALDKARSLGVRVSPLCLSGWGFQVTIEQVRRGINVNQLMKLDGIFLNDVVQAIVPDDLHVLSGGVWLWALQVCIRIDLLCMLPVML